MKKTLLEKIRHFELDTFLDSDEVKQIEKALMLKERVENLLEAGVSDEDFLNLVIVEVHA